MSSSGFVDAGSLMAFASSLPAQGREDILLSTLYMQLTSNKNHPDFKDFTAWNARYTRALRFLHYNASGRVRYDFFSSSQNKSVNLEKIIRSGLTPLLMPDELNSMDLLLQQVSNLGLESKGLKLLTRHALEQGEEINGDRPVNRVRIHAGIADEAEKLKMVTINLATREPIEPAFFTQNFVLSEIVGNVESEYFTAQLDEDYAELKRNTVSIALDGCGQEEIEKLF